MVLASREDDFYFPQSADSRCPIKFREKGLSTYIPVLVMRSV
jgi:hypothetical protein